MYRSHNGYSADGLEADPDASEASDHQILAMNGDALRRGRTRVNMVIVFVFVVELLMLVLVAVLEYFLRFTAVFPVRLLEFSCRDDTILYTRRGGKGTFTSFAYNGDISYKIIYSICFCAPPLAMLISELAVWAFSREQQKTIRAMCKECPLPQISRRVIRFTGLFLFGLLVTMVVTDVSKLMAGRLRPTFIEMCRFNATCLDSRMYAQDSCAQPDLMTMRDARLSFPSLHAAMASFAATYLAVYLHSVMEHAGVRVLRPFLTLALLLLSFMCALARYGMHYSHWTDVAIGLLLGIIIAIYIGVFVLNNFRERVNSQYLYVKLKHFLAEQRAGELRDYYKEDRLERQGYLVTSSPGSAEGFYAGNLNIPRPRVHANEHAVEFASDVRPRPTEERAQGGRKYQGQNTFQRDLQRTVDDFRGQSTSAGYGHM